MGNKPPICACGCGKCVLKSKRPPYNWNKYLTGHNSKGRYYSTDTRRKISEIAKKRTGEKAPNWQGGIACENYPRKYLRSNLREQIRERDNHTCQLCGKTKESNGNKLSVHHIDYNTKNSNPKNLITLCNACNNKADTNSDKEVYTYIFRHLIEKIYKI